MTTRLPTTPLPGKRPAAPKKNRIEANAKVALSIGDDLTDSADVDLTFQVMAPDGAHLTSGGMRVHVTLPEGAVAKDPAEARKMAKAEAAAVLRKMLTKLR